MDFPCLSMEALVPLEKEFVSFLIVNGIDGPAWEQLNQNNPKHSQELVQLFSNIVWEKIIQETTYLKRSSDNEVSMVFVGENSGKLYVKNQSQGHWQHHVGTKEFGSSRAEEVFKLLNQGFERTTQKEFSEFSSLFSIS